MTAPAPSTTGGRTASQRAERQKAYAGQADRHFNNADRLVRRCSWCGEWAWHLDACTVCATEVN